MPALRTVFHPSDFSKGDEAAFAHALKIALANQAELTVFHVDQPVTEKEWFEFPSAQRILAGWGMQNVSPQALAKAGLQVIPIRHHSVDPGRIIVQHVGTHSPDLVVLATHQRHGLARWLHHALAEPIARAAHVQTLFVPRRVLGFVAGDGSIDLENIVVPVGCSPSPQRALEAAIDLATSLHCPQVHFILCRVGPEGNLPAAQRPLPPGWTVENLTLPGEAVHEILSLSEQKNADLIVMSTAEHRGFLDALRGSTTERVLRGTKCPLLTIPVEAL